MASEVPRKRKPKPTISDGAILEEQVGMKGRELSANVDTNHKFQPAPLSSSEERSWATLAHLSILLNLITGMLGPVAALIIYLVFKDRSRYVAYQSIQAFIFQLIWWIGGGVLVGLAWTITGILTAVCIGLCLFPAAILISLIPIAALVYGVVGAVQCNQGANFRYWLIGDWVEGILKT